MQKPEQIRNYYKNRLKNCAIEDFLFQVGKTQFGKNITLEQVEIITRGIHSGLNLNSIDNVLDIGCANGLLSYKIAPQVQSLTGLDISVDLITIANTYHKRDNILFQEANIFEYPLKNSGINKIYMYEVLQHFRYIQFRELLAKFTRELGSFQLFIGGICDLTRIFNFYNDTEKRNFYYQSLEQEQPHMGNWWYADHLEQVCKDYCLSFKKLNQSDKLYTAHYRFDFLIWTNDINEY